MFYNVILLYLIITVCFLPGVLASSAPTDAFLNDSIVAVALAAMVTVDGSYLELMDNIAKRTFVRRKRKVVSAIFSELGPYYVHKSYRMDEVHFWKLYNMLKPHNRNKKRKRSKQGSTPNGEIPFTLRLSIAIRYFAGGSPCDLMSSHGVGYADVYRSIWLVVDTINMCPNLSISFPTRTKQRVFAREFEKKSSVGFHNCIGCIDGILIWTNKPSKVYLTKAKLGCKKFFCGRKKRYGLNMQAVCDSKRRFIDIDISHPASTSDYLAFGTSPICKELEKPGFLVEGLCLYGDNAYVNAPYMVTPFKAVSSGPKDGFNFYQSQLRINIECAFGMLVNRWAILRSPLPLNISLCKTTSLVRSLCCLHNWLIDEKHENLPPSTARDRFSSMMRGGDLTNQSIIGNNRVRMNRSLDGGEHYDDMSYEQRRYLERRFDRDVTVPHPREVLMHRLAYLGITSRPQPMGSTTTN